MAQFFGPDETKALQPDLVETGNSCRLSLQSQNSSFRRNSSLGSSKGSLDEEFIREWAKIERLPTYQRSRVFLFDDYDGESTTNVNGKRMIDVSMLGPLDRRLFIEKLIKQIEQDNLQLLKKLRKRMDKVGLHFPAVKVKYKNLFVDMRCEVVDGKPLPTLYNSLKSSLSVFTNLLGSDQQEAKLDIIKDVSGVIKPGRMTLLLGPPGCGKTSLLLALSGNLDSSLEIKGDVEYNGHKLEQFVPQKTSAYISQHDLHIPEMTVRETIDFSARCQGVGSRADLLIEVCRREKQEGIIPDPDIDAYMKAISVEGLKSSLQTDYILKILGLDVCADTLVGDAMRRGISGGQKKRLTTGEMIVGPTKVLFMDEITNGLDSSTAFQIVSYIQQLVHITDASALIALLQTAPETFDLFDDVILMAEGKIVYHGPRDHVVQFFETCGFRCPKRKGIADFLQEVISQKDQSQYWFLEKPYGYMSVDMFCEKFRVSHVGKTLYEEVSQPPVKMQDDENAISFSKFSLPKGELFKACLSRECLLMKRNSFIYIFKIIQLVIIAIITMTVFLRTRMHVDILHANYYLGSLFYGLVMLLVDGFPEVSMTIMRLPVFYKQRDLYFYPAWAYAIPATLLKVPLSILLAVLWTSLTYYTIGYAPEVGRFFCQVLLFSGVHLASVTMFRFLASLFQTIVVSNLASVYFLLFAFIFSGFIIPKSSMPVWLEWGFWVVPLTYGETGLATNEFLAPRWQKMLSSNTTIGQEVLQSRGLLFDGYFFWVSVGALFGFSLLCTVGYTLALTFLKAPVASAAFISREKLSQLQELRHPCRVDDLESCGDKSTVESQKGNMILPFQPLTVAFHNVQYYIDTPVEMREQGFTENKLNLLHDITGSFKPGVLTALMGVSGAGKTTLLDVLAGRKTSGTIEGDIRIGGYPKVQETFARVSGYCEQTDIHSPHITVEESLIFSAWLRLPDNIDSNTKTDFVNEVLKTIELNEVKDTLVGLPGVNGLSTEQRKRLTIAVELVANPSIIFMDEPTTGLDARAAAIVIRAVKNIAVTGRTVVCTIHQPSMDIFEAFDELVLLKTGGRIIYSGPLGQQSSKVIEYFQSIPGMPKIRDNYNPATWILEVTSASAEIELGIDFAEVYNSSVLCQKNEEFVQQLSIPSVGSRDLHFRSRFSLSGWGQYKSCLWKQQLSYWRSPSYNLTRLMFAFVSSLIFGLLFWQQGRNIKDQQSIFTVFGSMFAAVMFLGINNCSPVLPHIATEKTVVYRERFAGMYSSWAYSFAQVTVEIPYLLTVALIFTIITYPMIGYYSSAYKHQRYMH
ncbi:pleiotropic drug resistance protein 3-like isoform X2 [Beta vulgaris subsp. vulgaris]|uniref:pleiotropic drug resistance protein 3-like isoform X2 n=1 Tax=Beta vulgaris subsp. vulgaris TaxID=3555 RepID=UPI002036C64D|nr:pleiotropic drug resistance protein 3-like isoform X2 [Beta vulgaris subsp. vulgaris]